MSSPKPTTTDVLRRAHTALSNEFLPFNLRLVVATWCSRGLPPLRGPRLKTALFRWAGVKVGHGSLIGGPLRVEGSPRPARHLDIGRWCWVNSGVLFDTSASIRVGDGVAIAQDVVILTGTHAIGDPPFRAGEIVVKPVTIGDGCWLGARSMILPGVTLGAGCIVAAGAVVTKDVPPNSMVAGVPARVIRALPHDRPHDVVVAAAPDAR